MPGWLVVLVAAQGAILFVAGAVLFAGGATRHHVAQEWTGFWPLPLAPLTAQAVGAWLVAFGFAAAVAIWERDLSPGLVPATAYTAFGVFQLLMLLRYLVGLRADDPWLRACVAVLATIVATGAYGWWAAQHRRGEVDHQSRARAAVPASPATDTSTPSPPPAPATGGWSADLTR